MWIPSSHARVSGGTHSPCDRVGAGAPTNEVRSEHACEAHSFIFASMQQRSPPVRTLARFGSVAGRRIAGRFFAPASGGGVPPTTPAAPDLACGSACGAAAGPPGRL